MNIKIENYVSDKHDKLLLDFYNSLSNIDLYKRFHGYVKDFTKYLEKLSSKDGIVLLAFKDDELAGICEAYKAAKDEWEVAIIVSPKYRRLGIGRRLLRHVAKEVERRGGKGLYGIVGRDNYEAIEFGRMVGCRVLDNDSYTVKIYFELCGIGTLRG